MREPFSANTHRITRSKHLAIIVGLALAILAAVGLSLSVEKRLSNLRMETPNNVHWVSSRAEIELMNLQRAVTVAQSMPQASLSDVRLHFDTLYSQLATLRDGDAYEQMRKDETFSEAMAMIQRFLAEAVPLIDGTDPELRRALPWFESQATRLLPVSRRIAQVAMQWYAAHSDENRQALSMTLSRMGLVAISLVLTLSVLAVVLLRLSRQAQRQAETQHDSAQRLRTILGTALDAVLVFDRAGQILAFNGAAETMFGYTEDEAVGRFMTDIVIPGPYQVRFISELRDYLVTGVSEIIGQGRHEMTSLRQDGTEFPIEFSIDKIADHGGPVYVSFVRDITERKQNEHTLVAARDQALAGERAKAEFLAVMSHEMRTPLNGLLGTLSLLRDTQMDSRQKKYLENMDASGKLLMHHVNDVLEISKFEAGKVVLSNIAFDLNAMVREIIESQRGVAEAHGNQLGFDWLSDSVEAINGDPVRLRQVLLNLISNAIKFTRNGSIELELETNTDSNGAETLEMRVLDTGIGIPEKDIDRIFGDFETLDSTYGRRTDGTGLGLGIARRLTEAMGGEIGVDSIEGEGSIFWIRIPLSRAKAVAAEPATPKKLDNTRPLNVLIVEDNQINRVVLRDMLLADGHNVTEAVNGQEGVKLADIMVFDMILMDISMPVMDGKQSTKAIRSGSGKSVSTPIIAVTAHALPDEIVAFREAGMNDIIGKPIVRTELQDKLAKHCGSLQAGPAKNPQPEPEQPKEVVAKPETPPAAIADTVQLKSVDSARLTELMQDLGAEATQQLLTRFITETDETIETVSDGTNHAVSDLVPQLHKIAGSAAVLGASALHSRLGELEALGKTGQEEPFRAGLTDIVPIWAQTRKQMVALVEQA